ncbi:RluA family pseudouridine synthase [Formicincola oecophyllae]|uniref:Pseudouridine synthase n=1 Tax=Formicincola oecophyllae TaxID=2558361 RepID=A0A4Y6UB69_9PROT|nr:RluA family pseudouridine synthase [Formicincola oecophyllae]QDH13707.1 RluA family pseudouridine synthase [Formicincola oecophyllae]
MSHQFIAQPGMEPQRVDRYLAEKLDGLSRSRTKALIEQGHLRCNGQTVTDPAMMVRPGHTITLEVPPAAPATPRAEAMALDIIHEDDDLIVINKPAGLVVHPAPGHENGTLVNALLAHCGEGFMGIGGEKRPGIVHRLDKDTSGVMVVAKTERAHHALSETFATRRELERRYLAVAWGQMVPLEGDYEGNIGRDKRDRKRMAVVERGGKEARTHYETVERLGTAATLVACRLATGRTHQIRVHFAHNGHPLVGDPLYLRRIPAPARAMASAPKAAALDFPRQALHAASLGFRHPRTGEMMHFTAPLPPDMEKLLAALRPSQTA